MDSSISSLREIEEMESSIYHLETANVGMGISWFWQHLVVVSLEENCTFQVHEIVQKNGVEKLQSLSNSHPAFCLQAYL